MLKNYYNVSIWNQEGIFMQGLQRFSVMLFLIALSAFLTFTIYTKTTEDTAGPKIRMDKDVLEVSVEDGDKVLLKGVTARDSRDGDVTDTLVVENLSNFTTKNRRLITYAAFDSRRNVGKATREIQYKDYESPKFIMKEAPKLSQTEVDTINTFNEVIQATDCLDGDITRNISVSSTGDYEEAEFGGKRIMKFQVSNSAGDVEHVSITVPFNESGAPVANLTSYIVYLKKGQEFDPKGYLKSIQVNNNERSISEFREEYEEGTITIKNGVNISEPGAYQVTYTVTVGEESRLRGSVAYLQVIVRE